MRINIPPQQQSVEARLAYMENMLVSLCSALGVEVQPAEKGEPPIQTYVDVDAWQDAMAAVRRGDYRPLKLYLADGGRQPKG